ncbi:hypothetical protein [Algoriphagus terrigena]|uniref:hypothetical protein n=1 Tax=Algoriphagus terrigena TaxID=344884 RepID=UPI0003F7EA8A|nr:hypothetical protein [Algoriphagus terrigena]
MKLESKTLIKAKTELLHQVDHFDEFSDLYKIEHRWLSQKFHSKMFENVGCGILAGFRTTSSSGISQATYIEFGLAPGA